MNYIYRLAGNNLDLAEAELQGFLRSQDIREEINRESRIVETEAHPNQLRRLALTHEVVKEIDIDSYRPEGRYAVRTENLTDEEFDGQHLEEEVGEKISKISNKVDLDNPETVVKIYKTEDGLVYGELVEDIPRGLFEKRSNEKRPFSSPISMDPVLARVLVNLSEVSAGERLLDPFCGTGGILIEAGLCGIGVKGVDIQEEMVTGCKENLEEYGILNYGVEQKDIADLNELDKYNAIISDLPYGKASREENNAVEKFLELTERFDGKTVFMYNEASLGDYEADFEIYIHKSLTRYIYVV